MKTQRGSATAAALIGFCILILLLYIAVNLRPATWEYDIISPSDYALESTLKDKGRAGWEVASARRTVSDSKGAYEIILKRRTPLFASSSDYVSASAPTTKTEIHTQTKPPKPLAAENSGAPTLSYPAMDNPRAMQTLRACKDGIPYAYENGKWVQNSINVGNVSLRCTVEQR